VHNEEEIPDYTLAPVPMHDGGIIVGSVNEEYYRQLIRYYVQQKQYRPFRLAVGNPSDIGMHDSSSSQMLRGGR